MLTKIFSKCQKAILSEWKRPGFIPSCHVSEKCKSNVARWGWMVRHLISAEVSILKVICYSGQCIIYMGYKSNKKGNKPKSSFISSSYLRLNGQVWHSSQIHLMINFSFLFQIYFRKMNREQFLPLAHLWSGITLVLMQRVKIVN